MVKVYKNPTVKWYLDQVGYDSGSSKSSKYSRDLDSVGWYNYRKDGAANWCAIFYDAGVYHNADDTSNVNAVKRIVFEPANDNCGAGCSQKIQYYKANGAWYPHKAKGCPAEVGDEIFFGSDSYKSSSNPYGAYHTGAVVDWDGSGLYTVEGNTNGGKVSKRFYSYSDSRIIGFGRPAWAGNDPDINPEPTPEPEKKGYPGPWPTRPSRGYFQRGDTGSEVVKLQKLLEWTKPGCLPKYGCDGEIGSETLGAVKTCQAIWGTKVDGFYGKNSEKAAKAYKK